MLAPEDGKEKAYADPQAIEHCPTKPGPKLATRGTEATIPTKIPTKSYKTLEHGKCFYCKADEKTRNSTLRWGLLQSIRIM